MLFYLEIILPSALDAVGNLDLILLMMGGVLYMLCWSFATAFLDSLFIKGLSGDLALIKNLRQPNSIS